MGKDILIVDDEIGIRELLSEILMDEGYDVALAESAAEARQLRQRARPDLVLLDIWMPETDGISLLKTWKDTGELDMPVVMMSGHGTIDTAVEAMRIGAVGFLEKPIALKKLLEGVANGLRASPGIQATRAVSAMPAGGADEEDGSEPHLVVPLNLPLREARDLFERRYFEWLIEQTEGNMSRAADLAGVERTHLYRKLKQLGVHVGKRGLQEET